MLANIVSTPGVKDLVINAGPVAKFVLIVLGIFSVISWGLVFEKGWQFLRIRGQTKGFLKAFQESRNLLWASGLAAGYRESPLARLYVAASQEVAGSVNSEHLEFVSRALRKTASIEVRRMERYLPFLATTASASPFIGLFGTVWGVMESFRGIGSQGSASLAVVAPGISEALIATAAGLGAAIPAVMAYNFFVSRVKHWAGEIESFSLDLLNHFKRFHSDPSRLAGEADASTQKFSDASIGAGQSGQVGAKIS